MTDFEKHVERRARAICCPTEKDPLRVCAATRSGRSCRWQNHEEQARATFAADDAAGYWLVPEKATEEMLDAHDRAVHMETLKEDREIGNLSTVGLNAANAAGAVKEE